MLGRRRLKDELEAESPERERFSIVLEEKEQS